MTTKQWKQYTGHRSWPFQNCVNCWVGPHGSYYFHLVIMSNSNLESLTNSSVVIICLIHRWVGLGTLHFFWLDPLFGSIKQKRNVNYFWILFFNIYLSYVTFLSSVSGPTRFQQVIKNQKSNELCQNINVISRFLCGFFYFIYCEEDTKCMTQNVFCRVWNILSVLKGLVLCKIDFFFYTTLFPRQKHT